jgi:O-antigen ligase
VHFILAALVFESLLATWQFLSNDTSNRGMPHGTFFNNIKYSSFCGVGAAMCYGLFVSTENKNAKLGYLLTMGVLLFGSVLGQERHPWLAFIISGMAVTFLSGAKKRKARMMQFVAAILIVVIIVAAVPDLRDRVVSRFQDAQLDRVEQNTLLSRLAIWGVAWTFFVQHPILGVGPKSFTTLIPSILSYEEMGNLEVAEPHNVWLGVLAEGGIVGFVTYVALCVSVILLAYRKLEDPAWKPWRPFLFAYLSYHFFMFTMSYNYFTKAEGHMHFMMVGLMLGLLRSLGSQQRGGNLNSQLVGAI